MSTDKVTSLQLQAEKEMNIKNSLYAFILDQGMFNELREHELSHDISSSDCHKRDLLKEAQDEFETERNIKKNLYSFIINHDLYSQLKDYNRSHGFETSDSRFHAIAGVARDQFDKAKRSDSII
jgi:hypothetical protein